MTPSAISRKSGFAFEVQDCFGHDRARRISGTEEQNVVVILHWFESNFLRPGKHRGRARASAVPHQANRDSALAAEEVRLMLHLSIAASRTTARLLGRLHRPH